MGKDEKTRPVPMHPRLREVLAEWLGQRPGAAWRRVTCRRTRRTLPSLRCCYQTREPW